MIRPASSSDFDFIYNLYMHSQVNPFLLYEQMDETGFRPIFDELLRQQVKFIYGNETENIGMFKLIPLQHRNHHIAYLGGLAIHPSFAGKGEGANMMRDIMKLAESQNFLRIELSVSISNKRAIQLYENAGFQQEGVLRKFTHLKSEDRFVDEVLMSHLF